MTNLIKQKESKLLSKIIRCKMWKRYIKSDNKHIQFEEYLRVFRIRTTINYYHYGNVRGDFEI